MIINHLLCVDLRKMSLMKTLDLFARERGVVTREQMRNDYSRYVVFVPLCLQFITLACY